MASGSPLSHPKIVVKLTNVIQDYIQEKIWFNENHKRQIQAKSHDIKVKNKVNRKEQLLHLLTLVIAIWS